MAQARYRGRIIDVTDIDEKPDRLSWYQRAWLLLFAMIVLPICGVALFLLGVLAWAAITA
jgi:hypothetical protein